MGGYFSTEYRLCTRAGAAHFGDLCCLYLKHFAEFLSFAKCAVSVQTFAAEDQTLFERFADGRPLIRYL